MFIHNHLYTNTLCPTILSCAFNSRKSFTLYFIVFIVDYKIPFVYFVLNLSRIVVAAAGPSDGDYMAVDYQDAAAVVKVQKKTNLDEWQQLESLGSNKLGAPGKKPSSSSSSSAAAARTLSSRRHKHQKKNHRHHNHHHHQHLHNPSKDPSLELETRHRKYAKEKYHRKLERARKMQLQRDQKLEHQTRQLAEYERLHQARQKVYFGNFAEQHQKQFDSISDIDQHIDGVGGAENRERYPNLARLQTQLKEDRDKELPPYVRKYNRRNKQLFDLISGTNSPDSEQLAESNVANRRQRTKPHHHHNYHNSHSSHHRSAKIPGDKDHLTHKQKIERWIEENLFEEQRRNPNQIVRPPDELLEDPATQAMAKLNALPGELGPVASDGLEEEQHLDTKGASSSPGGGGAVANVHTNRLSQTRAGNFVYHRIAQSQPSNTIGQAAGAAAYGVIVRKPGLPFVAITDRRQEHQQQQGSKAKHV